MRNAAIYFIVVPERSVDVSLASNREPLGRQAGQRQVAPLSNSLPEQKFSKKYIFSGLATKWRISWFFSQYIYYKNQ